MAGSVPAIVAYLVFATLICVVMLISFDGWLMAAGSLGVLFCSYLTWTHYRAVFRAEHQPAVHLLGWLCSFCLLIALSVMVTLGLLLKPTLAQPFVTHVITASVIVFVYLLFLCLLLRQWVSMLAQARSDQAFLQTKKRYSLRELLLGITLAGCVLGGTSYLLRKWEPLLVEHVTPAACPFSLPKAASDVTFCVTSTGRVAYEFSIDKEGAAEWADAMEYRPHAIAGSFEVSRFGSLHRRLLRDRQVTIARGWYATHSLHGESFLIAYDEEKQRAYYFQMK